MQRNGVVQSSKGMKKGLHLLGEWKFTTLWKVLRINKQQGSSFHEKNLFI